ncbi:MAG: exonuclease domain-containing protein [Rhodospirillaceae bacterium]
MLLAEPEQTSRRIVALLFLVTGVTASVAAAVVPVLIAGDGTQPLAQQEGALLAGLAAGTVAWLWFAVNKCLLRPAERLAADTQLLATHGAITARVDVDDYPDLSPLPEAINALADRLIETRHDIDRAVLEAEERYAENNNRLAAILQDLHEGVLVCNLRHQVVLHNRAAFELLQAETLAPLPADSGQGRALISLMLVDPVRHTLERLIRQASVEAGPGGTDAGRFIGGTPDGRILLDGRMSLVFQDGVVKGGGPVIDNRTVTGYVLTFTDATRELAALGRRDALLRATTEDLRTPLSNLRAVMETLDICPDLEGAELRCFQDAMRTECDALTRHLEQIAEQYRVTLTGSWPMSDLRSLTLIELVRHRVSVHRGVTITPIGIPCRLHGDSFSLVVLLDHLIERIGTATGASAFDLSAEPAARWIYIDLIWSGAAIPSSAIDQWKADPLPAALGGLTVGDVLRHHRSDLWSENREGGHARLRLPLPPALARNQPAPRPAVPLEAIDFSVLKQPLAAGMPLSRRLDELSFVVFDTETTGFNPGDGDEIVAIAAVRVAGRRILTGETFQALVNPGRAIPPEATARHGITDQQVHDRPVIASVLPQFRSFAGADVLVGHHAALDVAFLRAKERVTGVRFDTPVLDTMLLSMKLQGRGADHSLDSIASRLGISAIDRHTALGDSLITAAVLLAQIDLLRDRGIVTLADVLREANALIDTNVRERLL